jgi:hypothetical protein
MIKISSAALLNTSNLVLQSIAPTEAALKMPASTIGPVPVPAGKVAMKDAVLDATVAVDIDTLAISAPRAMSVSKGAI